MNREQTKIAILLVGIFALFALFIGIGNEMDIQELREEIARTDSLHHKAANMILDGSVTLSKIEAYNALYGVE